MEDKALREFLARAPISRAVVRSREISIISSFDLDGPILDLGHGDGTFSSVLSSFGTEIAVGLDKDFREVSKARSISNASLVLGEMARLPFRSSSFGGVISNCVLEHLRSVDEAFSEMKRVLRPGGRAAVTVVTTDYEDLLFWPRLLDSLGLPSGWYRRIIRRGFGHRTILSHQGWKDAAARAGFNLEKIIPYVSPVRQGIMDIYLPMLLLSHLSMRLIGRYVVLPRRWGIVAIEKRLGDDAAGDRHANLALLLSRTSS